MLHLAERLADDPIAPRMVQRFCRLAESLEIDSPDLRLLADLAGRPADATEILEQAEQAFFLPWITGRKVSEPFSLKAPDDQLVVPVYFTDADLVESVGPFASEIKRRYRLERVVLLTPTKHEAMVTIIRDLPEAKRSRAQVIFDCTPAYVQWVEWLVSTAG